jgi:hypothetical protein
MSTLCAISSKPEFFSMQNLWSGCRNAARVARDAVIASLAFIALLPFITLIMLPTIMATEVSVLFGLATAGLTGVLVARVGLYLMDREFRKDGEARRCYLSQGRDQDESGPRLPRKGKLQEL